MLTSVLIIFSLLSRAICISAHPPINPIQFLWHNSPHRIKSLLAQKTQSIAYNRKTQKKALSSPLQTVLEWKELEFWFPSEEARSRAIADQSYIRGNSIPIDLAVDFGVKGERIFVCIPRFRLGRPMTLTTVMMDEKPGPGGPLLMPYPNYSWHDNPTKCEGMVSVFRVAIDPCNRMWVLDTGRIGIVQHCPPQLLVFDLKTDQLVHKYQFQLPIYRQLSAFVTPILDVRDDKCEDLFVYIADVAGFGLIVYDYARNKAWRIDNKLFYPYPSSGTHWVAGEQFELMDGILGMSLGPMIGNDRFLYFQALASNTLNRVATSVIRNSTTFETNSRSSPHAFQVYNGRRSCQSVASAIDSSGIMYFGLSEEMALGCWHIDDPYGGGYIQKAVKDDTTLQFASGIKIISHQGTESIWIVTNRFQKLMAGTMTNSTVNFRIMTADVEQFSKVCNRHYGSYEMDENAEEDNHDY